MSAGVSTHVQSCVAIVSDRDDLHALAAQKTLAAREGVCCHVIECDRLFARGGLAWSAGEEFTPTLPTTDGECIDVRKIDVLWFRRCYVPQKCEGDIADPAHLDVINTSTPPALLGVLLTSFRGRWISDPGATREAENKLFQLRAAHDAGLAMPRTLVSNDPASIRDFCSHLDNQVIVKAVKASFETPLLTQKIRPEHLESDERLRLCPAIYQEYVPGCRHLRAHLFGDHASAILIDSPDLDWRTNLNVPCSVYDLDESLISKLRQLLKSLNLRMGVIDLKMKGDVPMWLEVNPQGQFLFAEGLTGLPLRDAISEFLYKESLAATAARLQ